MIITILYAVMSLITAEVSNVFGTLDEGLDADLTRELTAEEKTKMYPAPPPDPTPFELNDKGEQEDAWYFDRWTVDYWKSSDLCMIGGWNYFSQPDTWKELGFDTFRFYLYPKEHSRNNFAISSTLFYDDVDFNSRIKGHLLFDDAVTLDVEWIVDEDRKADHKIMRIYYPDPNILRNMAKYSRMEIQIDRLPSITVPLEGMSEAVRVLGICFKKIRESK